jgi:hypothetical protein
MTENVNDDLYDLYGTVNPAFHEGMKRFKIYYKRPELDEEPGWRYKLEVIDNKYLDSDGFPINAIAGGNNYNEAFERAKAMTEQALNTDHCIF